MPFFLCRLNAPRPDFATTMTADEQELMGRHGAHWMPRLGEGRVPIFGVVMDPAGPWGCGILEAADEAEARAFTDEDPVITAGAGFSYDVLAMPNAVTPGAG